LNDRFRNVLPDPHANMICNTWNSLFRSVPLGAAPHFLDTSRDSQQS